MVISEDRLEALHTVAQMRGIHVYRSHLEAVQRMIDHRLARGLTVTVDSVFDALREAGSRMTFAQERGLRQWLTDIEQTRQHKANLDIERTRRALRAERPVPYTYRGRELRELLKHDADERGYMRGPVIRHENGLRGNPPWVL